MLFSDLRQMPKDRQVTISKLAGFADVLRCELETRPDGCALGVRMGDELVVAEWLADERAARERAAELRQRFVDRGWCTFD